MEIGLVFFIFRSEKFLDRQRVNWYDLLPIIGTDTSKLMKTETLLHPSEFTEHKILTAILDGSYPPDSTLPGERELASQIGVTRPTLRETLQRLAGEGWITIQHGRPTRVNDYWRTGGLSLLGTLSKYARFLPAGRILNLLEFRCDLFPAIAAKAAANDKDAILEYLRGVSELTPDPIRFADFDWELQVLSARNAGNPIYNLIINDFEGMFKFIGRLYFESPRARNTSLKYYRNLSKAVAKGDDTVRRVVSTAMKESVKLWKSLNKL